jgi:GLPGLI family protein
MVIKIRILLFSIIYTTILNAQSVKVLYTEKTILPDEVLNQLSDCEKENLLQTIKPETHVLIYSDEKSVFFPCSESNFKNIEKTNISQVQFSTNTEKLGITESIIYKNFVKNIFRQELTFLSVRYSIRDTLTVLNWNIYEEETKMIAGYICKKATCNFSGQNITAFFTPEIKAEDGPDMYCGLNGLILELISNKKIYTATKIKFIDDIKINPPLNRTNFISRTSFIRQVYNSKCIECEEKNNK